MAVTAHRKQLAGDLYAVFLHLMKQGDPDVFRTIAELELSLTQLKALNALDATDEPLSVGALADLLSVSLPAMSRSVEGLHVRGFVERHEDAVDRRMKRVEITDAGRTVPRAMHDARLRALEELVEGLDAKDAERLAAALAPIAASPTFDRCRPEDRS